MTTTAKVTTGFSMSLDGFIAGPNENFQQLFAWMNGGDTDYTLTIGDQQQKLKISPESIRVLDEAINATGALITGRRLYELTHGWGGHHPINAPIVVVTHRPQPQWVEVDWPVTFTDNLQSALAQAEAIANGKNITILSTTIVQQCLDAGLLDEIHIDLVPFILGDGIRLFEHLKITPIALGEPQVNIGIGVTHLTYSVEKER
jgi:dihydrofolate reductase